ncbi:gamma carbonic anhydrase family protein [Belnapia rosea]|uniref:Carbonic anhydrase or acetyltransferase, isoleucine patch superfamily n=1 Tax=Belnapia rosea TaxID=938405 RepID=A0A1G6M549_9PROT|nr:gamma carbonic anhydrase family protein [Belnapia rosea]SDB44507.1 Carbonic anhydrase or acetyltransferase, isoleucine patch superfamily [Belnapia rosea]SDC50444.1 Carbonic anhydrase or acetyltransferase, isoleucine patch superfamily [Belnapia rosea]
MPHGPLYPFEGKQPVVDPSAWVAPTAAVIGDVTIGPRSNIWYHCVLRGDTNFIRIGAGTNIQDGTIIHVNAGRQATSIGDDVTVGHAAIIHACTLMNRAFVGMGATVLDDAVIEEGGVLAAGSVLPPGKRIAALELWMGNPAKLVRLLTVEQRAGFDKTAPHYVELSGRHRASLGGA